jgi:hypothetical protein
MQTIEVAVEYVLVGLLAFAAFVLPFLAAIPFDQANTQSVVGLIGLAYFAGVVFDKIMDVQLSPIEQFLRFCKALELVKEKKALTGDDPFPQDLLEFEIRKSDDGRSAWMDALRSRIRMCRGVSVLGIPAAMGFSVYRLTSSFTALGSSRLAILALLGFMCISTWMLHCFKRLRMPRTSDVGRGDRTKLHRRARLLLLVRLLPLLLIESFSLIAIVLMSARSTESFLVGAGSIFLTSLAFFAWLTISTTYLSFIATRPH